MWTCACSAQIPCVQQVTDMWNQYQQIGSKEAQIKVIFESNGMRMLHALMSAEERSDFKVTSALQYSMLACLMLSYALQMLVEYVGCSSLLLL